jgi:hypothetical protein
LGHFTLITATILAHISGSALFRRARKEMHNEKDKKSVNTSIKLRENPHAIPARYRDLKTDLDSISSRRKT